MSKRRNFSATRGNAGSVWLRFLGLVLFISGFLAVLSFLLFGISHNLPLSIGVHLIALTLAVAGCIRKYGSITEWISVTRAGTLLSVPPRWILFIGLFFTAIGVYFFFNGKPREGANAMNPDQIRYFSSVFIQIGAATVAVMLGDMISGRKRRL